MSTDCESVVSPSLGSDNLPHPLNLPSNGIRTEGHPHSGISYEGRVSLISPLGNYESSMRAAFGFDKPRNILPSPSPHHFYSPPFSSPQTHLLPNSSSQSTFASEENQRVMLPINNYPLPTNRSFEEFNIYQEQSSTQNMAEIKQESVDVSSSNYDSELPSNSDSGNVCNGDAFSKCDTELENVPEEMFQMNEEETESHSLPKVDRATHSYSNLEDNVENSEMANGETYSDPNSPFAFNETDNGPPSVNSDQNESREIDPVTFMSASYTGNFDMFNLHGENSKALKCQFCSYSTDIQSHFASHLNTHFVHKCLKCEHTTETIDQLKEHMLIEHDIKIEDIEDLENTRVPQINSQGKMKTFKCKQCKYIAVTKGEFWSHAKFHIKSEKLLSCSKCPFVTEYKHHLEYHMRNHLGSKPFRCNKCNYSCVNKSMLNSHLKSHSNIYQYRCSDCTYATKYCHSLKLHLRKYGHTPAMVLNPDGTPNPVPIIDVYGTRRGPKIKKDENGMPILPPQYQLQAHLVRAQMEATGAIPPAPTVPLEKMLPNKPITTSNHLPIRLPFPNPFSFPPPLHNYPSFIPNEYKAPVEKIVMNSTEAKLQVTGTSEPKEESLNVSKSPEVDECFVCEICSFSTENKDILSHHTLLHNMDRKESERKEPPTLPPSIPKIEINLPNNLPSFSPFFVNHNNAPRHKDQQKLPFPSFGGQLNNHNNLQDYFVRALNPLLYSQLMAGQNFVQPAFELQQQLNRLLHQVPKNQSSASIDQSVMSPTQWHGTQSESVLDLSKEQTPPNAVVSSSQGHSSTSPSFLPASPPNSDISTPPLKSRRKGRAFKLERIALRLSGSGEEGENEMLKEKFDHKKSSSTNNTREAVPPLLPMNTTTKETLQDKNEKWGEAYQCQYCDIAFKDAVMYTMHMGYHGYKDPFTCNMCGYDASDKLAFFLHIGRSSHL